MNWAPLLLLFISAAWCGPVEDWEHFEKSVRDQKIEKDSARSVFPGIYQSVKQHAAAHAFRDSARWVFPVEGHSIQDAGKGGFKPDIRYGSSPVKGYDFYDGNRHGGHPAYDLFIRDKNMDSRDDRTGMPVDILAPVDLIILSENSEWLKSSGIRGGNYIWALQPSQNLIFYFAHMDSIAVSAGSFCRAGSVLGTMGRTGKNAWPARSPTHLHLMVLEVRGAELMPFDYWEKIAP